MQEKIEKTLHLAKVLGSLLKEYREKAGYSSRNKFAGEYDLDDSNLGKIENARIEAKFVTILKISQAFGVKLSKVVEDLEQRLGEEFTLIDK